jgi:hypothetical protein
MLLPPLRDLMEEVPTLQTDVEKTFRDAPNVLQFVTALQLPPVMFLYSLVMLLCLTKVLPGRSVLGNLALLMYADKTCLEVCPALLPVKALSLHPETFLYSLAMLLYQK